MFDEACAIYELQCHVTFPSVLHCTVPEEVGQG